MPVDDYWRGRGFDVCLGICGVQRERVLGQAENG